jgi:hypothetical protein
MGKRVKTEEPVSNPRKLGPHVSKTIDFLSDLGAENVKIYARKHLRISFIYQGKPLWFMLSSTPRNPDECAQIGRSLARKAIREATQA